jgi:methylated-DNA-[protein]-cysteine S-methyltransferase
MGYQLGTDTKRWPEWAVYESPIGPLTLLAGPTGLGGVHFPRKGPALDEAGKRPAAGAERGPVSTQLAGATAQLAEYFGGDRRRFDLDLDLRGTPLQLRVWELLRQIPYGATTTYGDLAAQIEDSLFPAGLEPYRRVRMAAAAIGRTPTPIIVPCHRVIGADGSLTGYGGGLQRKAALLDLERRGVEGGVPVPGWGDQQLALI